MVKIRKRVTLMAVVVSVIFGVCWLTDACMYVLNYIRSPYSDVAYGIASIMILFNSAVNPFVYALVNQRFRQKIKGMLCCKCRSTIRIHTMPPTTHIAGVFIIQTVKSSNATYKYELPHQLRIESLKLSNMNC